jgi:hypothetical protein
VMSSAQVALTVKRPHIQNILLEPCDGRRVASTLWLPHLLHRSRFTNAAIGVFGPTALRVNASPVRTPTCRQLKHSTTTAGAIRNACSDMPKT